MKTYKHFMIIGFSLVLIIFVLGLISCRSSEREETGVQTETSDKNAIKEILYYTCGMHPSVRVTPEDYEKGNNKCPICQMDLVPVYDGNQGGMETTDMEPEHGDTAETIIRLSPQARDLARVKTEAIDFRLLYKQIKTVGEMNYDERKLAQVSSWISGRIDDLYVDFTGYVVRKKQRLAQIYSPNLLTTQEEFLLALETLERVEQGPHAETIEGAQTLVDAAKKRLLLWGISEEQIKNLEKSRKASTHMTIHAPAGGTVIQKKVFPGQYVKEGEILFLIADLSSLWMEADVYEYDLSLIQKGQDVIIMSQAYPGEIFFGKISYIDPYLNPKTRTVKVRVDVPNPEQRLKPGMYVNAEISSVIQSGIFPPKEVLYVCPMHPDVVSDSPGDCPDCGMALVKKEPAPEGTVLAVPREAVLDTGIRKLVYIEKEPGIYAAREVNLGLEAESDVNGKNRRFYAVRSGLSQGEKVVINANFLIDSQSQITGQAEAVYSGALERGEESQAPPAKKHIH